MRRAIIALAAAALASLAFAGSASAASGQVTHFTFSGTFANAFWITSSANVITDTLVNASTSSQGSQLLVDQFSDNLDVNGSVTGFTDTSAEVTSGYSFAIKQPLASASVSASGLPATTCTFDANFNLIGCTPTTIDVNVNWTGQGPISRSVSNTHAKSDGFNVTTHFNATGRAVTAIGTVGGLTLTASDLQGGELGTTKSGTITVCTGTSC